VIVPRAPPRIFASIHVHIPDEQHFIVIALVLLLVIDQVVAIFRRRTSELL
jgi:hypothetical protein